MDLDFLKMIWLALSILDIMLISFQVFLFGGKNLALVFEYSRRSLVDVRGRAIQGQVWGEG